MMAGNGSVEITANNSICANAAGIGHIKYKGNATDITRRIAGNGSITKVD